MSIKMKSNYLQNNDAKNPSKLTSRDIFGQYDALRTWRLAQVIDISRSVSSLTHEQFDISSDSN